MLGRTALRPGWAARAGAGVAAGRQPRGRVRRRRPRAGRRPSLHDGRYADALTGTVRSGRPPTADLWAKVGARGAPREELTRSDGRLPAARQQRPDPGGRAAEGPSGGTRGERAGTATCSARWSPGSRRWPPSGHRTLRAHPGAPTRSGHRRLVTPAPSALRPRRRRKTVDSLLGALRPRARCHGRDAARHCSSTARCSGGARTASMRAPARRSAADCAYASVPGRIRPGSSRTRPLLVSGVGPDGIDHADGPARFDSVRGCRLAQGARWRPALAFKRWPRPALRFDGRGRRGAAVALGLFH